MVSIVILSLNPSTNLLEQLKKQTYQDFEVIVANDVGIVSAMNIALVKAKGDIFVRIDDDVSLPPMWLEELIKPFSDPMVAGVTGPTLVPPERQKYRDSIRFMKFPHPFIKWVMDYKYRSPAKILQCGSVSYGSNFLFMDKDFNPDHLEGTNWAMRTDLIRKVGGFDPAFDGVAEWYDTDVEQKILKLGGYRLQYAPNAYLYHMLEKGSHYNDRFEGWGRIKNWLRFHSRHSKFHYKKIIWLLLMTGYFIWQKFRSLFRR